MTRATTEIQPTDHVRVTTMAGEAYTFRVATIDESGLAGPEHAFLYTNLVMIERSEVDVRGTLYMIVLAGLSLLLL